MRCPTGQANLDINKGATPCHAACAAGHGDVVRVLAEHGANLETPFEGSTPEQAARRKGFAELSRLVHDAVLAWRTLRRLGVGGARSTMLTLIKALYEEQRRERAACQTTNTIELVAFAIVGLTRYDGPERRWGGIL